DHSLLHDGLALFTGRLFAFSLVFATPIVLTRLLSLEDFGLYRQIFLVHVTMCTILPLGLPASLCYFVLHDPGSRSAYISQTLLLLGLVALVGAGIVAANSSTIATAMNSPGLAPLIPLVALLLVGSIFSSVLENLMIASKHARLAAAVHLASEITRACLVVAAAFMLKSVVAILWAAVAWACSRCVALLVYVRHLRF